MVVKRRQETFDPVTLGHIRSHGSRDLLVGIVIGAVGATIYAELLDSGPEEELLEGAPGRLPHCQYRLIKQTAAVEKSVQQCSLQSVMQIEIIACIALNPDYSRASRRVLRYPVSESSSQSMMPVRKLM
jgi:hypothetical protein